MQAVGPVNMSNPLGVLDMDGVETSSSKRTEYLFPLPNGTRVVTVRYDAWGYIDTNEMVLFLAMELFIWENNAPKLFSDIKDKVSMEYGTCNRIKVEDGVLHFSCCCPSPSTGRRSKIRFYAYG